jgi:hypothetical protein
MHLIDLNVEGGQTSVDTSSVTVTNEGKEIDSNVKLGLPRCEGNYQRERTMINVEVD